MLSSPIVLSVNCLTYITKCVHLQSAINPCEFLGLIVHDFMTKHLSLLLVLLSCEVGLNLNVLLDGGMLAESCPLLQISVI